VVKRSLHVIGLYEITFLIYAYDWSIEIKCSFCMWLWLYVIAGHRAVELCMYVSHRADSFICRISKPPRTGEVLPKFSIARLLLEDGGP
jgi:hypothetical protein